MITVALVKGVRSSRYTQRMRLLVAIRPGALFLTLTARRAATFDRKSGGRLRLNAVRSGTVLELADGGLLLLGIGFAGVRDKPTNTIDYTDLVAFCTPDAVPSPEPAPAGAPFRVRVAGRYG